MKPCVKTFNLYQPTDAHGTSVERFEINQNVTIKFLLVTFLWFSNGIIETSMLFLYLQGNIAYDTHTIFALDGIGFWFWIHLKLTFQQLIEKLHLFIRKQMTIVQLETTSDQRIILR